MDVSPCSTLSHFLCWEGARILKFCMKFNISFQQKWYGVDHEGLVDAIKSSSNHPYTSKEGYKTRNQQWMSLLIAHHPISCTERVLKFWYFVWTLIVGFTRKDIVWTIRGSHSYAARSSSDHTYIIREGTKPVKQQWLSLLVAMHPFSHAEGVPEIWYISWKLRVDFGRNYTVWIITVYPSHMFCLELLPIIMYTYLVEGFEIGKQQ